MSSSSSSLDSGDSKYSCSLPQSVGKATPLASRASKSANAPLARLSCVSASQELDLDLSTDLLALSGEGGSSDSWNASIPILLRPPGCEDDLHEDVLHVVAVRSIGFDFVPGQSSATDTGS